MSKYNMNNKTFESIHTSEFRHCEENGKTHILGFVEELQSQYWLQSDFSEHNEFSVQSEPMSIETHGSNGFQRNFLVSRGVPNWRDTRLDICSKTSLIDEEYIIPSMLLQLAVFDIYNSKINVHIIEDYVAFCNLGVNRENFRQLIDAIYFGDDYPYVQNIFDIIGNVVHSSKNKKLIVETYNRNLVTAYNAAKAGLDAHLVCAILLHELCDLNENELSGLAKDISEKTLSLLKALPSFQGKEINTSFLSLKDRDFTLVVSLFWYSKLLASPYNLSKEYGEYLYTNINDTILPIFLDESFSELQAFWEKVSSFKRQIRRFLKLSTPSHRAHSLNELLKDIPLDASREEARDILELKCDSPIGVQTNPRGGFDYQNYRLIFRNKAAAADEASILAHMNDWEVSSAPKLVAVVPFPNHTLVIQQYPEARNDLIPFSEFTDIPETVKQSFYDEMARLGSYDFFHEYAATNSDYWYYSKSTNQIVIPDEWLSCKHTYNKEKIANALAYFSEELMAL